MEKIKQVVLNVVSAIVDGGLESIYQIRNFKESLFNQVLKISHIQISRLNMFLNSQLQPQLPIIKNFQTMLNNNFTASVQEAISFPIIIQEVMIMPIQSLLLSLILITKGFFIFMISIMCMGVVVVIPIFITKYLLLIILIPFKYMAPTFYDKVCAITKICVFIFWYIHDQLVEREIK